MRVVIPLQTSAQKVQGLCWDETDKRETSPRRSPCCVGTLASIDVLAVLAIELHLYWTVLELRDVESDFWEQIYINRRFTRAPKN